MPDFADVVEVEIDAFRPRTVPPFESIRARHDERSRRRAVAAVAVPGTMAMLVLASVLGTGVLRNGASRPGATVTPSVPGPTPPGAARADVVIGVVGGAAVLLDADDIGGPALARATAPTGRVSAVAAVGDGSAFYSATTKFDDDKCHSVIYRVDRSGDAAPVAEVELDVVALATTHDGRRLAYVGNARLTDEQRKAVRRGLSWGHGEGRVTIGGRPEGVKLTVGGGATLDPPPCWAAELRVRDLAAQSERTWKVAAPPLHADRTWSIAWAPDGRHLAYQKSTGAAVLDTTADGARVELPWTPRFTASATGESCFVSRVTFLPSGDLAGVQRCAGNGAHSYRVVRYDARSNRVTKTLFQLPGAYRPEWLVAAPSGDRFVISALPWQERNPFPGHDDDGPHARYLDAVQLDGNQFLFPGERDELPRQLARDRRTFVWDGRKLAVVADGENAPEQLSW